jgi:hypothetical protein
MTGASLGVTVQPGFDVCCTPAQQSGTRELESGWDRIGVAAQVAADGLRAATQDGREVIEGEQKRDGHEGSLSARWEHHHDRHRPLVPTTVM